MISAEPTALQLEKTKAGTKGHSVGDTDVPSPGKPPPTGSMLLDEPGFRCVLKIQMSNPKPGQGGPVGKAAAAREEKLPPLGEAAKDTHPTASDSASWPSGSHHSAPWGGSPKRGQPLGVPVLHHLQF